MIYLVYHTEDCGIQLSSYINPLKYFIFESDMVTKAIFKDCSGD